MKVVVNRCFGGFSISIEAAEFMAKRGNKQAQAELNEHREERKVYEHYRDTGKWKGGKHGQSFADIALRYGHLNTFHGYGYTKEHRNGYDRSDPDLVAAVENLGEKSGGECANLAVVEIPDDVEWEIEEYDGQEWVSEKHRTW